MAEYWKSTPKYWCKFCEIFVRDTPIERKNHEASGKHQNSIQKSLRELHKGQAKLQRDQEKAKEEISRLNKLVGSKPTSSAKPVEVLTKTKSVAAPAKNVDFEVSHRAQMKQLAAMGIHVPNVYEEEVATGGGWQAVPETFVDVPSEDISGSTSEEARVKGVHKRKADDDEEELKDEQSSKRRVWGSTLKTYPGKPAEDVSSDLDALLSGVSRKQAVSDVKSTALPSNETDETDIVKQEVPSLSTPIGNTDVKDVDGNSEVTAPPVVAFKKRKGKR